jgi:hypothetical protein
MMVTAVVFASAVLLIGWNFFRLTRFETDYRYVGSFSGNRYECVVGGLDLEHGTLCIVGADKEGVYLLSHPKPDRFYWGGGGRHRIFKRNLMIPWSDFSYRSGKVLLRDCVWIEMPSRRIYLFVPKDVGEKLLRDAGRGFPI